MEIQAPAFRNRPGLAQRAERNRQFHRPVVFLRVLVDFDPGARFAIRMRHDREHAERIVVSLQQNAVRVHEELKRAGVIRVGLGQIRRQQDLDVVSPVQSPGLASIEKICPPIALAVGLVLFLPGDDLQLFQRRFLAVKANM